MGSWGVKSYENDEAADAIDAGYDQVHGAEYEALMDDRNPLSFDEVQKRLASPETLSAAIDALVESLPPGLEPELWDAHARLAFVGIVVRHAEFRVPIPPALGIRALEWLEQETLDWDEATLRRLAREREIKLLRRILARDQTSPDLGPITEQT